MASRTTQYGFEFEAATVERLASHKGYAVIGIRTPRMRIEITVTPSGLLRFGNVHKAERKNVTENALDERSAAIYHGDVDGDGALA